MTFSEKAFHFGPPSRLLLGVLAAPHQASDTGVIVVVGGPQYRVGSHRQFVLLARTLAAAGYPVLRFDFAGMGDSVGALQDFQDTAPAIGAALDALQQHQPALKHVVLWGLCDGASAALLFAQATHDARLAGLCLLNPWVRSPTTLARAQLKHYYRQRLTDKEFWLKLLQARVSVKSLLHALTNFKRVFTRTSPRSPASFQDKMALAWQDFPGSLLLVLSGQDLVAKEFLDVSQSDLAWSKAWAHPRLRYAHLPDANHTFSSQQARQTVAHLTLDWLQHQVTNRAPLGDASPSSSPNLPLYASGQPCTP
jgi:exosortase A-associated hydrolase 1